MTVSYSRSHCFDISHYQICRFPESCSHVVKGVPQLKLYIQVLSRSRIMFLSSDGSQHIIWYKNIHVWLKQWEAFGVKIEM